MSGQSTGSRVLAAGVAVRGFALLFGLQWLGDCLATAWHLPVPGAVLGMLLLFLGLVLREQYWLKVRGGACLTRVPVSLEVVSTGLIQHLALFFLPVGIGIFFLPDLAGRQWLVLAVVIFPGTVIALLVTALLLDRLLRSSRGQGDD